MTVTIFLEYTYDSYRKNIILGVLGQEKSRLNRGDILTPINWTMSLANNDQFTR